MLENQIKAIYEYQEENRYKFNLGVQQHIFHMLDEFMVTMPLIPGVLNEKYQRKPSEDEKNEQLLANYKEYKQKGQQYKGLHAKCTGWNKQRILNSYTIDTNTDKIAGCPGNIPCGGKLSFICVDIDNFTLFKKKCLCFT